MFQSVSRRVLRHGHTQVRRFFSWFAPPSRKPLLNDFAIKLDPLRHFEYKSPALQDGFYLPLRDNQRVVAMGDMHGDVEPMLACLLNAQLIDIPNEFFQRESSSYGDVDLIKWIGGDSVLVQTGDLVDRGFEDAACIGLLTSLSQKAFEKGGAILMLLGNHELMNAKGIFDYAQRTDFSRVFGGEGMSARENAMMPNGFLSGHVDCLNNFLITVQVGKSVFVHGGLIPEHIPMGDPSILNKEAQRYFNGGRVDKEALDNPVWYRGYTSLNSKKHAFLEATLALFRDDATRMVVGHTPLTCIKHSYDGKLLWIDTAMSSEMMNGTREVVEIINFKDQQDEVNIILEDGERERDFVSSKTRLMTSYR